ncbi:MAG: response regulator [Pseudomonadota bacterium]|nr:response regulator [Burkholderiaceae bacterium]MDQ3446687.1 response regulator [Pseudomonadota bacterium]
MLRDGKGRELRFDCEAVGLGYHLRAETQLADLVRILMIEDNQDAAEALAELLRLAGHQVEVAPDGAKGLELFEHVRPDVVLCDLGLPGMNGYESPNGCANAIHQKSPR